MSIGAINEPARTNRLAPARAPTEAASLPEAGKDPASAAEPGVAPGAVPQEVQQGIREMMRGIEGGSQRALEQLEGWDEAGIRKPCPRGGNCGGATPKRGLRSATPPRRMT